MISVATSISLEAGCDYESCAQLAAPLLHKLGGGDYDVCSVMEIPSSIDEWRADHRTARKRSQRAYARGYLAAPLRRELRADDIHAINTSKRHRQGRPMNHVYMERQEFSPLPDYPCERHAVRASGVYLENTLVAYLIMYRVGELALVSQILGHGDHERHEIMYRLFEFALGREIEAGPGFVVYNRHDSGTDGLRWFKERLGFGPAEVEWRP